MGRYKFDGSLNFFKIFNEQINTTDNTWSQFATNLQLP